MSRISGPCGLPHSCAAMVRPSGVFTLIGLYFSSCAVAPCARASARVVAAIAASARTRVCIVMAVLPAYRCAESLACTWSAQNSQSRAQPTLAPALKVGELIGRGVGPSRSAQMPISAKPFAQKKFATVLGRRMAYLDAGEGDAIVFQHGNPTSSYLWRNVMPHCVGLGRLIACDLVGMGDSDKLPDSGPARYRYAEQRDYLFALWDHLALGDRIVFVIHDWGSALGFDWANANRA